MPKPGGEVNVRVRSLYGAETRRGLVMLRVGEEFTMMPPNKAREIAGMLLECAESAETDEFLVAYFQGHGFTDQQLAAFLDDFRRRRAERDKER